MNDVVIVGAGPTGLTIGLRLAAAGRSVTLIDEWEQPGGCLAWEEPSRANEEARALIAQASANPAIEIRTSTIAWAAFPAEAGFDVMLNAGMEASSMSSSTLVLATGTTDVVQSCPGSTLPGVMTERAFRILVAKHGVIPGERIALVGGASSGRIAAEAPRWNLGSRITNVSAKWLQSINGAEQVESLSLANGTTIAADVAVLSLGEAPDLQLAGMLGTPTTYRDAQRAWFAIDPNPLPGLHLAGGTLLGQATLPEVLASANATADRILGQEVSA